MLRSIALKTLYDGRRGFVWWSLGIVALVLLTVALYPSIEGNAEYDELLEDYPEFVQSFIGTDLTSPAGYLYSQLFSLMVPLLLMIYVVSAGARAVAGEEEAGTLDLLLSHPVSRTRVVLEKAAAMAVQLAMLTAVLFLSIALPAPLFSLDIGAGPVAEACLASYLLALVYGAVALLVGAATGRRAPAIGVPAALAVGGYLVDGLGRSVDVLEPWRVLSPFAHAGNPLADGVGTGIGVLVALAAAAVAASLPLFTRRDLAV